MVEQLAYFFLLRHGSAVGTISSVYSRDDLVGKPLRLADFFEQDHLGWTQVSDLQFWENKAAKLFGVTEIPQNFFDRTYRKNPRKKYQGQRTYGETGRTAAFKQRQVIPGCHAG